MKTTIAVFITIAGLLLAGSTADSMSMQTLGNTAGVLIFWIGGRMLIKQCKKEDNDGQSDIERN